MVDGKVDLWLSYILTTKITKDKEENRVSDPFGNFSKFFPLCIPFACILSITFMHILKKWIFFLRRSYLCEFKRNHIHIINITTCPIIFAWSL